MAAVGEGRACAHCPHPGRCQVMNQEEMSRAADWVGSPWSFMVWLGQPCTGCCGVETRSLANNAEQAERHGTCSQSSLTPNQESIFRDTQQSPGGPEGQGHHGPDLSEGPTGLRSSLGARPQPHGSWLGWTLGSNDHDPINGVPITCPPAWEIGIEFLAPGFSLDLS